LVRAAFLNLYLATGGANHDELYAAIDRALKDDALNVRLTAAGNRFKMFLDGKLLQSVVWNQHPRGCVGLITNPARARFRNLKVTDAGGTVLLEGAIKLNHKDSKNQASP
jgi:hypothetical protein